MKLVDHKGAARAASQIASYIPTNSLTLASCITTKETHLIDINMLHACMSANRKRIHRMRSLGTSLRAHLRFKNVKQRLALHASRCATTIVAPADLSGKFAISRNSLHFSLMVSTAGVSHVRLSSMSFKMHMRASWFSAQSFRLPRHELDPATVEINTECPWAARVRSFRTLSQFPGNCDSSACLLTMAALTPIEISETAQQPKWLVRKGVEINDGLKPRSPQKPL